MHEGHRQRMYDKLEQEVYLCDHELLEIILYNVIPRMNTNPVAHRLLDRFCSLSSVFKADVDELKCVEGVGDKVAHFLKAIGMCYSRINNVEGITVLNTLGDFKKFVAMRLNGKKQEFLELYLIEKSGLVKRILTYTSSDRNKVVVDTKEVSREIALAQPYGILAAHNHLNNCCEPSDKDDLFTNKLSFICKMNGVKFWDHIIFADGNVFSYTDTGRMEEINRKFPFDKLM